MCIHWETLVGLLRTKNLVSSHPEDVEDLVGKLSDPSYLAKKTCGEHSKLKFMLSNKKHQQTRNLLDNFLLWTFQNVKKQSNYKPNIASALSPTNGSSPHIAQPPSSAIVFYLVWPNLPLKKHWSCREDPPKKKTPMFSKENMKTGHTSMFSDEFLKRPLWKKTNRINSYHLPSRFNR